MSLVITTLKNVAAEETFNVSDYPACKLFYQFDDAAGNVTPVELIFGNTHTVTLGGFTFDGVSGTSISPALVLPGTKAGPNLGNTDDFVAVLSCDLAADNKEILIQTGTGVNQFRFKRLDSAGTCSISDSASDDTVFNGQTDVDGSTEAIAMYSDRGDVFGNGADFYMAETDGVAIANAENLAIAGGADDSIDFSAGDVDLSGAAGPVVYGIAVFQFSSIPPDVLSAVSWMNYQWRQGNKIIYPPWKGKI